MKDFSYITNSSPAYIESLYNEFLANPENVDPDLKKFFEGFDFALSNSGVNGKEIKVDKPVAVQVKQSSTSTPADFNLMAEINVYRMILGYRNKGHLLAKTNPIRERKDRGANIDLSFFGFSEVDLDKEFYAGQLVKLGKNQPEKYSCTS